MKGKIIFWLMLLVSISSSYVFGAISTTSGTTMISFYIINITMVNQEPSPAEAGRYVTVRFKVENAGRENAEDITLELLPQFPFSLDPGGSALKYVGSVYSKQVGKIGVIKDYRLKVDENAVEGDNKIELRYKIKDGEWIKLEPFYINIKPHDVILSIIGINAPKMIKPGETSTIDINLKNFALTFVKDIKVKLSLDNVPFATIGSTNRKTIRQIGAGSNATVSFSVMAEPDSESGLYKVPIEVEFLDRLGTTYRRNETVGLIIGDAPDLSVILDSSEVYSKGQVGEITIKIVNKGVTDVKFLNVILKNGQYRILSPKEVYVGNIDSDDYETAEFKIALKKVKGNEAELPLLIEYKDANNNEYSEEVTLSLKLYSTSEAKTFGFKKGNGKIGILIVLIIVVGGIFFYMRWKKKKEGKKIFERIKIKIPFLKKK